MARLCGATAAWLRFQESRNVPELIPNRRSVDSPERAANVHLALAPHNFDAAPADSRVDVFIDPRPWDRRHLRQIDRPGSAAHFVTARRPMSKRRATFILAQGVMVGPPPSPSGGYRGTGLAPDWNWIEVSGGFAWSCLFDTHNDLRLAVDRLSGALLDTIYAEGWKSVRSSQLAC
jgi:hypothetical protein